MSRLAVVLALALLFTGCAPTAQEQVRLLSDDGVHLYRSGSYAEAGDQFRAALTLRPEDPDLLYNLARCNEKLGRPADADQLYERVIHHRPDHAEARHALVSRRVEAGQRDVAGRMVQGWLKASPNLAGPYVEDGWLRARDGDLDSARARFLQALEIEPRNARAMNELAQVYERLDRPDRASVLYERSLEADPDQPETRRRLDELRTKGVGRPRPD
ncbi:MAG: tetratricopeptide repeat protein [Gemmataceae bacterium]